MQVLTGIPKITILLEHIPCGSA